MGQEALSLPEGCVVSMGVLTGYETVPTGEYIARFLNLSSHFGKERLSLIKSKDWRDP
jgi:hypothetical protein